MSFVDCKNLPLNLEIRELLIDFTLEALRNKPANLLEFSGNYFQNLFENRNTDISKSVVFDRKVDTSISKNRSSIDSSEEIDYEPKTNKRRFAISSESWSPYDFQLYSSGEIIQTNVKTSAEIETLKRLISKITIFKTLADDEINDVIVAMNILIVKADDIIIQQGDPGDHFYVIQSGIFDVYIRNKYNALEHINTYNNQGSFGELSLLYNSPRSATVIARTAGILWYMNRKTFKSIVILKSHERRLTYINFISSVPLFDSLTNDEKINIADAIHMKTYDPDSIIIHQGDVGKHMYFIERGKVGIYVDSGGSRKQIAILESGHYFGELSLMTNRPRAATAVCLEKTVVGILERSCFERLLGPCIEILQRNALLYDMSLQEFIQGNLQNNTSNCL